MKSLSHVQSGLTLMELLIALAIAALLAAPLGAMVLNALSAQSVAGNTNDVAQQAQFAMQRMETAVRRTAPHILSLKLPANDNTSADWLVPVPAAVVVTFCLLADNNKSLIETKPDDLNCNSITPVIANTARVIADGVSAFSVQTFSAGAGAGPVIEIQFTVTGATGQSISLTSHTRLGGGTL